MWVLNYFKNERIGWEGGKGGGTEGSKGKDAGREGQRESKKHRACSFLLLWLRAALGTRCGTFSTAGSMPGNTGILWGWLTGVLSVLDGFSSSSDSSLLGDFSSVAKKKALTSLAATTHEAYGPGPLHTVPHAGLTMTLHRRNYWPILQMRTSSGPCFHELSFSQLCLLPEDVDNKAGWVFFRDWAQIDLPPGLPANSKLGK